MPLCGMYIFLWELTDLLIGVGDFKIVSVEIKTVLYTAVV